jgi:uncharacterized protein (TIGR03089 family)
VTRLIADLLTDRARRAGAEPLITYYDLGSGERTELSGTTFANWVAKTANLLLDEVGGAPGDRVHLPLALEAPGHWLTAAWQMACWQIGAAVDLTGYRSAVTVVTGPTWRPYIGPQDVYACALHPLGFGFPEPLPPGVIDYAIEVRSQPDFYLGAPPDPQETAWVDEGRTLTQADLVGISGSASRQLLRPSDPWTTCRRGLLRALVTGGSIVVVVGDNDEALRRIAADERALLPDVAS